jgi:hypothetical protein
MGKFIDLSAVGGWPVFIPLLIASGTIAFNAWSQRQQARLQFELKAAELVMSSPSPFAMRDRAEALAALFGGRFAEQLATIPNFDPGRYGGLNPQLKRDLVKLVLEHYDHRREILEVWRRLHRDEQWREAIDQIEQVFLP